jgi:hypothetical protein
MRPTDLLSRVEHFWCGLWRHDPTFQWSAGRIYSVCSRCGYESPGWTLDATPPHHIYAGRVAPSVNTTVEVKTRRVKRPKNNVLPMRKSA